MSILVVDDLRENQALLEAVLSSGGYTDVKCVGSAEEAMETLGHDNGEWRSPYDLVLMDYMMPHTDGIEAVRRLKAEEHLRDIPVILITGHDGQGVLESAFDAGVVDYIVKPIDTVELLARIRSALALKREMDMRKERERELLAVTKKLAEVNETLHRLSSLDGLTGIANRRSFDQVFEREWRRCRREGTPLSMLMIDIDHFKRFNDRYGHLRGDDCLRAVAEILETACQRASDLAARYGGEEFAVVLSTTDFQGAKAVADGLRLAVQNLAIPHAESPAEVVTISIGVASMIPTELDEIDELLAEADRGLYEAKQAGRNKVRAYDLSPPVM